MIDLFKQADERVSVHEGGYVNHPKDPGGATDRGVTQRVYDAFRQRNGMTSRDVRLMTDGERVAIYRGSYWLPIKGDQLPPGVGYVVYDGAVNSGVSQSVKWLQRALGIKVDGVLGPATLAAAQQDPDHDALIVRICERRMSFLRALKTWKTFGKGWTRRVDDVRATGQAWAMGSVGPAVEYIPGGEAKARVEDAKAAPSTAPGDTAAGGGTISVVISQAQEQLTPYVNIGFVAKAVAILTIGGVVVAIGGIAYRMWAAHKARQRADALDLPVAA